FRFGDNVPKSDTMMKEAAELLLV
ncbi:MAG: hypothetical protein JWR56_511, partial [Massilia sp.]|nr:hypothetical protein [Massilia sp.]